MKSIRLAMIILLGSVLMCGGALANNNLEITTGTQELSWIVDQSGTPLYGNLDTGDLIQIIHIGSGSIPHLPDKNGNPTNGDVLVDTTFVGQNFLGAQGKFSTDESVGIGGAVMSGWNIYVRAWNSTEASSSTYWGTSEVYQVQGTLINEKWDINGPGDVTAFATSILFDNTPPGPPISFNATREVSGNLILTWTPTNQSDAVGTLIRWSLTAYPTNETDGNFLANVPISSGGYMATGLTSGTTYYFSAFSYDGSFNYSTAASTRETAIDSLPPTWESFTPADHDMYVPLNADISVQFDDTMNQNSVQNAIHVSPPVTISSYSWPSSSEVVYVLSGLGLTENTYYTVTIDSTAADKAMNPLPVPLAWTFRTTAGLPPTISNFKIDGWIRYPGDVISPNPVITANLYDPLGFAAISTVEISANSMSYTFGTPEIGGIYDNATGYLNLRFPTNIPPGIYTMTLTVWDVNGNPTEESVVNLQVMGGEVKTIGPAVNYPNPFESGGGTTLAYTLTVDSDVQIYIYSIKGTVVFNKRIAAGTPGGTAGYNEVFWNGLSNFNEEIGTGIYIVKIASGNRVIATIKVVVVNRQ